MSSTLGIKAGASEDPLAECAELKRVMEEIRSEIREFREEFKKNPGLVNPYLLIETVLKLVGEEDAIEGKGRPYEKIIDKIEKEEESSPVIESNWAQVVTSFEKLNLDRGLLRGIYSYGFEWPSPIQQRLLMPCINGMDVIAQAPRETGRTVGIVIGLLQRINQDSPHCQALYFTFSTEVAQKIHRLMTALTAYMGVSCHLCRRKVTESRHYDDCAEETGEGHGQILVGSPLDILSVLNNRRRGASPREIQILVIDDADKLFAHDDSRESIDMIMRSLDLGKTQIIVMSNAVMHPNTLEETNRILTRRHPVRIVVKDEVKSQPKLGVLREFYVDVDGDSWKFPIFLSLFEKLRVAQAIVFCNTESKLQWLSRRIEEKNFKISPMLPNVTEEDREVILKEFGAGTTFPVLVTTPSASLMESERKSGDHVAVIFNFDFPDNPKDYSQRTWLGRRYFENVLLINLITTEDKRVFPEIQNALGTQIKELPSELSMDFVQKTIQDSKTALQNFHLV